MYADIKTNNRTVISERLEGRRCIDLLGILFALMVLCVLAEAQITSLPYKEAAERQSISGEMDGELSVISEISTGLPFLETVVAPKEKFPQSIFPSIPQYTPFGPADFVRQGIAEDDLKQPAAVWTELPEEPEAPEAPAEIATVPDDTRLPCEKIPEEEQMISYNGFLCDPVGRIIGCDSGISVTDGVLRLPSDQGCTGVAAGAFSSLEAEVCEVYIPANIISIEDGAFGGLPGIPFIQVHPDNPVYGSKEGYLYVK